MNIYPYTYIDTNIDACADTDKIILITPLHTHAHINDKHTQTKSLTGRGADRHKHVDQSSQLTTGKKLKKTNHHTLTYTCTYTDVCTDRNKDKETKKTNL